jgi:PAS domain S-box-containing protein
MTDENLHGSDPFQFLGHDGAVGAIIREFDWSTTPLGRVETWPHSLRTATALLLHSPVPIVMLWGDDGVMIYNDAYSVFAGHRHPALFGSKVREGWSEISDFTDHVMRTCLAGETLAYRDQELTLHRKGYPEQVWMDLDYSPVPGEDGRPAGVIAIVVDTSERVRAQRRIKEESQRLQNLFSQAPTFMAMLGGADHRFEMVNPEYRKLIGGRDVIGLPIAEALPEVAEQGYAALLDEVFETGDPLKRMSDRVLFRWNENGPLEERFVDFVYQPIRDDKGKVTHIFVQGSDVTERVRAGNHQKLLINELNHRVKNTLASIQSIVSQTLRGVQTKEEASEAISSRILALSRAHNVLTDQNWDGSDLHAMVESSMEAFRPAYREPIAISGPRLRVGPQAALSIALALHELATNAVKYGALSSSSGSVAIEWSVAPEGRFILTWTETGGPRVRRSDRKGFGSRLILRVLPKELRGTADMDFREEGLVFKLETSMEAVLDSSATVGV